MRRLLVLLLAASLAGSAWAQRSRPPRAIPLDGPVDVDELLRLARVSQAINAKTYFKYSFRQTSRTEDLDDQGEVKRTEVKVYRVIPSREGTIRHLLESDGEEPSAREVKKQLARNEKLRKRWAKIRKKQEKENAKRRAELERRQARAESAAASADRPASPPPSEPTTPAAAGAASDPPAVTPQAPARAGEARPEPVETAPPAPPTLLGRSQPHRLLALDEEEPDLAEFPTCELDDIRSALRQPPPGSVLRSRAGIGRSSEAARKARQSTGDYTIFELLSLTNYEYLGTCVYEERIVHVVAFDPATDFDPLNPVERVVTAMTGTIFIDAADIQVMRTEAKTVAPIKWGAGMVKLRAAEVLFEARKVNDEVWLPSANTFMFDSRVLFDRDRQRFTHFYDDYKKLSVTSTETFEGVAGDG